MAAHIGTKQKLHLDFLDGLRGWAAAMVLFCHIPAFTRAPEWVAAIGMGNPWVAIFITLSGFCLFLPAASRASISMPRPFVEFMRRRARRILPAWYASLFLCVATGWFFLRAGYQPPFSFLPVDTADVVTHLTLTHSMFRYAGSINAPGYTLGTEWQLYILMALFLHVAARRGWLTLLCLVTLVSLPIPGIGGKLLHKIFNPTFTVPFVIGIVAAHVAFRPPAFAQRDEGRGYRWTLLALIAVSVAGYFIVNPISHNVACWLVGIATGSGCVFMAVQPSCLGARVFGSRPLKRLGDYSYSLYLTHFPLLALIGYAAHVNGIGGGDAFFMLYLPALPLVFGFAFLFHLLFERPFMHTAKSRPRPALERGIEPASSP